MEQHESNIQHITERDHVGFTNNIESLIRVIRGKQVMLDRDLAELYEVETAQLNRQVKRNIERFPEILCFN